MVILKDFVHLFAFYPQRSPWWFPSSVRKSIRTFPSTPSFLRLPLHGQCAQWRGLAKWYGWGLNWDRGLDCSQLTSYRTVYFQSGAALFTPHDVVVCQNCVLPVLPIHSEHWSYYETSLALWSILHSSPLIDCIMVNRATMKVWPGRQKEFMIPELFVFRGMSCFYVCVISIYTLCVCVFLCVCALQSAGSVSVPPDTGLRPTCFWGREDKREINCSTSSASSALLLREQFVGWRTRQRMRGGGHGSDSLFLGDPVIQQRFPAVDLGRRSRPPRPPARVTDRVCFTGEIMQHQSKCIGFWRSVSPALVPAHSDTCSSGPVTRWQKTRMNLNHVMPLGFSFSPFLSSPSFSRHHIFPELR